MYALFLFFFSQCTRPFTAIVTTTSPGKKTKIQQRGARKKKKSLAIPRWATHRWPFLCASQFSHFFLQFSVCCFQGFLSSFLFWFFGTRSPWIFAIMETNVGLLNLSIGLPKVAKAGKEIFIGLGRTGVCFYSFATAYANLILKEESTESVLSTVCSAAGLRVPLYVLATHLNFQFISCFSLPNRRKANWLDPPRQTMNCARPKINLRQKISQLFVQYLPPPRSTAPSPASALFALSHCKIFPEPGETFKLKVHRILAAVPCALGKCS